MANRYPWQQGIWQQLIDNPRPAHAYLLHGPEGTGKYQLALALAKYWLCQQPKQQACGQCSSCKLIAADSHPDLLQLLPVEKGKNIVISQVRELVDTIMQTSQQGGRQVVIIEPAEAMGVAAANALLKSLEEPTKDTYFILVSHQLGFLLPTIKSRCLLQRCPLPTTDESQHWLQQQVAELTAEQAQQLLQIAGHSPLLALELAKTDGLAQRATVVAGMKQLFKGQATPSDLAGAWAKIPLTLIFAWFAAWGHELFSFKITQLPAALRSTDMAVVLGFLAKHAEITEINQTQQWVLAERQKVLQHVPLRADLLLESLLIRWQALLRR